MKLLAFRILVLPLALTSCYPVPPAKVSFTGGGALGTIPSYTDDEGRHEDSGAGSLHLKMGLNPLQLWPGQLARRLDLGVGYQLDFYPALIPSAEIKHGPFAELTYFPWIVETPDKKRAIRLRRLGIVGLGGPLFAQGDYRVRDGLAIGFAGDVGVSFEYVGQVSGGWYRPSFGVGYHGEWSLGACALVGVRRISDSTHVTLSLGVVLRWPAALAMAKVF
jgi:hypothetical protein